MDPILVLLHTSADGILARGALEVVTAGRTLAGASPFCVGVVGASVDKALPQLAGCGAAKVLVATGADFAQPRYATDAAAAEAIAKASGAKILLAPHTSRWARILPGVAHRLGGAVDTHVTAVADLGQGVAVTRWYYRQRIEANLRRAHRPWVIAIESGCHEPWKALGAAPSAENVPVVLGDAHRHTTVEGIRSPQGGEQTIRPEAELLFVTGAGWTKLQADGKVHLAEAEKLIRGFLTVAKASLGSSKSLVDLGGEGQAVLPFLTHLHQVGQTGSTPRHAKGLSACCFGEEPHTVGWRFVGERRAIDLNPACGWARGKADVLYVADAFQLVAKVNALLGGAA